MLKQALPKPLVVGPYEPAPLKVVGEEITILAPGAVTGSYEIFHQAGPDGSGPPPHSHQWDEAFYVINGEVIFGVGHEPELAAGAGTFVHVPAGTTHWFPFGAVAGATTSAPSPPA